MASETSIPPCHLPLAEFAAEDLASSPNFPRPARTIKRNRVYEIPSRAAVAAGKWIQVCNFLPHVKRSDSGSPVISTNVLSPFITQSMRKLLRTSTVLKNVVHSVRSDHSISICLRTITGFRGLVLCYNRTHFIHLRTFSSSQCLSSHLPS